MKLAPKNKLEWQQFFIIIKLTKQVLSKLKARSCEILDPCCRNTNLMQGTFNHICKHNCQTKWIKFKGRSLDSWLSNTQHFNSKGSENV